MNKLTHKQVKKQKYAGIEALGTGLKLQAHQLGVVVDHSVINKRVGQWKVLFTYLDASNNLKSPDFTRAQNAFRVIFCVAGYGLDFRRVKPIYFKSVTDRIDFYLKHPNGRHLEEMFSVISFPASHPLSFVDLSSFTKTCHALIAWRDNFEELRTASSSKKLKDALAASTALQIAEAEKGELSHE